MQISIVCETDKFNLSVIGNDFINDCCFGEDFSIWLVSRLNLAGLSAKVICMEDFGWANDVQADGNDYLMCIGGQRDRESNRPNYGEWRVMLEKNRSLWQKISGKDKFNSAEPIFEKIVSILTVEGFVNIQIEP